MDAPYIVSDVSLSDSDIECVDADLEEETNDEIVYEKCCEEEYNLDPYLPIKSANEKPDLREPLPEKIELSADDRLILAGHVVNCKDDTIVIKKANDATTLCVLDYGTIMFLENGEVLGQIYDTLGPVKTPYYAMYLETKKELTSLNVKSGTPVYYAQKYCKLAFENLYMVNNKGSDASNEHDEEIDESEAEFSDDEEEKKYMALKKNIKRKNLSKKTLYKNYHSRPLNVDDIHGSAGLNKGSTSFGVKCPQNENFMSLANSINSNHNTNSPHPLQSHSPGPNNSQFLTSDYPINQFPKSPNFNKYFSPQNFDHSCRMPPPPGYNAPPPSFSDLAKFSNSMQLLSNCIKNLNSESRNNSPQV